MVKKPKKKLTPAVWVSQDEVDRLKKIAILKRAKRQQQQIGRLARGLDREVVRTNRSLRALLIALEREFTFVEEQNAPAEAMNQ